MTTPYPPAPPQKGYSPPPSFPATASQSTLLHNIGSGPPPNASHSRGSSYNTPPHTPGHPPANALHQALYNNLPPPQDIPVPQHQARRSSPPQLGYSAPPAPLQYSRPEKGSPKMDQGAYAPPRHSPPMNQGAYPQSAYPPQQAPYGAPPQHYGPQSHGSPQHQPPYGPPPQQYGPPPQGPSPHNQHQPPYGPPQQHRNSHGSPPQHARQPSNPAAAYPHPPSPKQHAQNYPPSPPNSGKPFTPKQDVNFDSLSGSSSPPQQQQRPKPQHHHTEPAKRPDEFVPKFVAKTDRTFTALVHPDSEASRDGGGVWGKLFGGKKERREVLRR